MQCSSFPQELSPTVIAIFNQFPRWCSQHGICLVDLSIIKSCFLDYQKAMCIFVPAYLKDEAKEIFNSVFNAMLSAKSKLFQIMLYEQPQTIFFILLYLIQKYDFSHLLKQASICNGNKTFLLSLKSAKFYLLLVFSYLSF